MRFGDRFLQQWRIRVAESWIPDGSRVLDIGCYQGEFLQYMGDRIVDSIGIDPLAPEIKTEHYALLKDTFSPPTNFGPNTFDAIVILATFEHMINTDCIAMECARILRPAGRVIITVPSPLVDQIIDILVRMRVLDGMSMEEHHGFQPSQLPHIFRKASLFLLARRRFQLGLNNLFVFEKDG